MKAEVFYAQNCMKPNSLIKTVLVTGGTGFVGSHVVDALLSNGYRVRVMSARSQGSVGQLDVRAEFFQGDVCQKEDWRLAVKDVDAIIHLAACLDSHPDISRYFRTNVESIALAFEVLLEEKVALNTFILASSQILYGEGKYFCRTHGIIFMQPRKLQHLASFDWDLHCPECSSTIEPLPMEESDQTSPQSPYAISTLAAEQLLLFLGKKHGISCTVLRYAAVIGNWRSSRRSRASAVGAFSSDVTNQRPIQMNEDGQQLRDFVHVKDVASAHLLVLGNAAANGQIFNIGTGQAIRVIDLAKTVAEVAGVEFTPQFTGRSSADVPRHALMNISKLKRLGFQSRFSLRDMVRDYFQSLNVPVKEA